MAGKIFLHRINCNIVYNESGDKNMENLNTFLSLSSGKNMNLFITEVEGHERGVCCHIHRVITKQEIPVLSPTPAHFISQLSNFFYLIMWIWRFLFHGYMCVWWQSAVSHTSISVLKILIFFSELCGEQTPLSIVFIIIFHGLIHCILYQILLSTGRSF